MKNAYSMLGGEAERRDHSEDPGRDRRIM